MVFISISTAKLVFSFKLLFFRTGNSALVVYPDQVFDGNLYIKDIIQSLFIKNLPLTGLQIR
jgi:hypothetical protein